jgi:hypothetical protein
MPEVSLKVDSLTILQTFTTLGDMLADLGPSWGKVRDEVNGSGFVGIAVRNPAAREEHLQTLDRFLKALAQECTVGLQRQPGNEQLQQALLWIQQAYADFCASVTRELV